MKGITIIELGLKIAERSNEKELDVDTGMGCWLSTCVWGRESFEMQNVFSANLIFIEESTLYRSLSPSYHTLSTYVLTHLSSLLTSPTSLHRTTFHDLPTPLNPLLPISINPISIYPLPLKLQPFRPTTPTYLHIINMPHCFGNDFLKLSLLEIFQSWNQ